MAGCAATARASPDKLVRPQPAAQDTGPWGARLGEAGWAAALRVLVSYMYKNKDEKDHWLGSCLALRKELPSTAHPLQGTAYLSVHGRCARFHLQRGLPALRH